jgi:hypothetical protein
MVFRDGQATPIPAYTRFVGSGENDRFGYSQTLIDGYSGVDWLRTVVWLKRLAAFVVLDRLTALEPSDYQFRLLWHGVGAAALSDQGQFLTQKGPSFWIQPAPGTRSSSRTTLSSAPTGRITRTPTPSSAPLTRRSTRSWPRANPTCSRPSSTGRRAGTRRRGPSRTWR